MKATLFLILCTTLCYNFLLKASADGVFQVKLLEFSNKQSCTQCRIKFFICLAHFQSQVATSELCVFGNATLEHNSFYSSTKDQPRHKPVQFSFVGRWHGYFSLIIDILDEGNVRSSGTVNEKKAALLSRATKSQEIRSMNNTGEHWRVVFHKDNGLELQFAYRVVCTDHTYGPYCSAFCRPRNDTHGHYSCGNSGERLCLSGWTNKNGNPYCTKAICSAGCNESNGKCVAPNICRCNHEGWTGADCSQCKVLTGCAKGSCSKPYECKCDYGWGGRFCNRDLHYCARNKPCYNGGFCRNSGERSYLCECKLGFTGKNCEVEIDECRSDPCQNGGTCVDMKNGYLCICPDNFYEKNSKKSTATCFTKNPCLHGGTCVTVENCLSCLCPAEYAGKFCQTPVEHQKSVVTCQNGGSCTEWKNTSKMCVCERCICSGYFTGKMCQLLSIPPGINQNSNLSIKLDKKKNDFGILNTGQWIGICFGSTVLVAVLVMGALCLLYHRKIIFTSTQLLSKQSQTNDNQSCKKSVLAKSSRSLTESSLVDVQFDSLNAEDAAPNLISRHSRKKMTEKVSQQSENQILCLFERSRRSTFELQSTRCNNSLLQKQNELPTYEEACQKDFTSLRRARFHAHHNGKKRILSSSL